MKVAVLAGGVGSRIAPDTNRTPKPLVSIGGRPILWHLLQLYAQQGFTDFLVALGHRASEIQPYLQSVASTEGWSITCVDTGPDTGSGGRVLRLAPYLTGETFMLTWCDGLADIDLEALLAFHRRHGRLVTVTAAHPPERFGCLRLEGDSVASFEEKPVASDRWINGAFFVVEPEALNYIDGDNTAWELGPMSRLVAAGQLMAYRHESFWHCMDTGSDRQKLERLWSASRAPWVRSGEVRS